MPACRDRLSRPASPPLSCRTSPPQGGRLDGRLGFANPAMLRSAKASVKANLPPCGGDVRQDRGGRDVRGPADAAKRRRSTDCRQFRRRALRSERRDLVRIASVALARIPSANTPSRRASPQSPPTAKRQRCRRMRAASASRRPTPRPGRSARRRRRPPTLSAPAARASPRRSVPSRMRSASGRGSAISSGSSPASGPVSTGTPARTAMPSPSTSRREPAPSRRQPPDLKTAARRHLHHAVAVAQRGFAESDQLLRRQPGRDRIEPHQQAVAGLHRRGQRRAGAAAQRRVHAADSCAPRLGDQRRQVVVDRIAQRVPEPAPARRGEALGDGARRGRVLAQHEGAHALVAEIGVMRRPRSARREWPSVVSAKPTSRSTVSANSGRAARAVPHLAGDEARIDGAGPHDAGDRLARPSARGAAPDRWCRARSGRRLPPSAASAAAKPPMKATSAEPSRMSRPGSSPVWTSRSASRQPLGEGAGRGLAVAVGAAEGVRGGGQIGAADLLALAPSRRSPAAPRCRRRRCRARSRRRGAAACRSGATASASGLSPSASSRAATAPTAASISAIWAGNMSRNRPEMRQVTSTRGRPSAAGGSTSMPVTRPVAASHCGRQPISARPCAISSPPVRS